MNVEQLISIEMSTNKCLSSDFLRHFYTFTGCAIITSHPYRHGVIHSFLLWPEAEREPMKYSLTSTHSYNVKISLITPCWQLNQEPERGTGDALIRAANLI